MIAAATALWNALPEQARRDLTAEDHASIADVLDAAADWRAGKLPWWEAAAVGVIPYDAGTGARPSPGFTRTVALLRTDRGDPRRAALRALLDELVRQSGAVVTTHGVFTRQEIGAANAPVVARAPGQQGRRGDGWGTGGGA